MRAYFWGFNVKDHPKPIAGKKRLVCKHTWNGRIVIGHRSSKIATNHEEKD